MENFISMELYLRDSKVPFPSVLPWKKYNCGFSRAGIKAFAQSFSSMSGAVSRSVSGQLSLRFLAAGHQLTVCGALKAMGHVTTEGTQASVRQSQKCQGPRATRELQESRERIPFLGDYVFPNFQGLILVPHPLANPQFPRLD